MTIDWVMAGPYVVAFLGFGGAWLTSRIQHKGKPENALIDQLQEQQVAAAARMASLEKRIAAFEDRDVLYIPHIIRLNAHIDAGYGPPSPPIPKAIRAYLQQQEEEGNA